MAAAQALTASPWGTGSLVEKVIGGGSPAAAQPGQLPGQPQPGLAMPPQPQRGLGPDVLSILNRGNRMFGLDELPSELAPPRQPTAPGLAPPPSAPATNFTAPKTGIKGARAINIAHQALGIPYVWGGTTTKGFDCSGLLQYAWKQAGVDIPRTTYEQFKAGTPVAKNQLQQGDAVFFKGSDSMNGLPGHVGIYIGNGKFIEAPRTGLNVRISSLAGRSDYQGARRFG
jgi:cell wall-associated NlpC family hydrolase